MSRTARATACSHPGGCKPWFESKQREPADLPDLDSDAKVAYDAAYLLAGRLGARVQFELLRAQTADLLQRPRAVRLVRRSRTS